jgi:hypothetical protein
VILKVFPILKEFFFHTNIEIWLLVLTKLFNFGNMKNQLSNWIRKLDIKKAMKYKESFKAIKAKISCQTIWENLSSSNKKR